MAAEAGSAEAALALGETFDPLVFRFLGVIAQYLAKLERVP